MRIAVDPGVCQGHGQCAVIDFDLFLLDDNGFSAVGSERAVPAADEAAATLGVSACPVGALRILDDE
jgi:ferredoxin